MQNTYHWKVIPFGEPTVIRNCPKCGNHAVYESSGNFRVNANQSLIDVWLIYQCRKCKSTWNMEILSRTPIKIVNQEMYQKFLCNDSELARYYAFHTDAHKRNKAVMNYADINYDIVGDMITVAQRRIMIELSSDYSLDLRLDRLIGLQLGFSREKTKKLLQSCCINGIATQNIKKVKLQNGLSIQLEI